VSDILYFQAVINKISCGKHTFLADRMVHSRKQLGSPMTYATSHAFGYDT